MAFALRGNYLASADIIAICPWQHDPHESHTGHASYSVFASFLGRHDSDGAGMDAIGLLGGQEGAAMEKEASVTSYYKFCRIESPNAVMQVFEDRERQIQF